MSDEPRCWERAPILYGREESEKELALRRMASTPPPPPPPETPSARHRRNGELLLRYARAWECKVFIETGTLYGEMVDYMRGKFNAIHSIELSTELARSVKDRFAYDPSVQIHQGDSSQVLPGLVGRLKKERALFWLDAHFSGGATAHGKQETPILDELEAILAAGDRRDVILIDDLREFQRNPAYPSLSTLARFILERRPGAGIELLAEDVIAVTPAGKRSSYPQSPTCQIATLKDIYLEYFGGKTGGVYVDVGAHDGYTYSNTWGLAASGWQGLCFEPLPELAEKCRRQYTGCPKVTVLEAAIGAKNGVTPLYTDGNPTINRETVDKGPWGFTYDPGKVIQVPVMTLHKALLQERIPFDFDVLSIDVEGAELEVLDGISFKKWRPRLVIVETGKDHPVESFHIHTEEIERRMLAAGFREIYFDAINSIYAREP